MVVQPIDCPLCNQTITDLPNDTAPGLHYRACSNTRRNTIREKAATEPTHTGLNAYRIARSRMRAIARQSWTEDDSKTIVRIARMWRANELLGRADYVAQLSELPDFDEFEQQDDQVGPATARLIAALTTVWQDRVDDVQVVVAVEDFLVAQPQESRRYTYRDDNTAASMDFMKDEKEHLRNDMARRVGIFDIARSFNAQFPQFMTHPLAISRELVSLQLRARYDAGGTDTSGWSEREENILLRLLGLGLPMVEVVRSLNAEIAELASLRMARRETAVVAKVDELLATS